MGKPRNVFRPEKNRWKWQRPNIFGTTEDLFTQTIVVPYLIPMLENAGATVFTPRERDYQTHEIIIDNNNSKAPYYIEYEDRGRWEDAPLKGFAYHNGTYNNSENPFEKRYGENGKSHVKEKQGVCHSLSADFRKKELRRIRELSDHKEERSGCGIHSIS